MSGIDSFSPKDAETTVNGYWYLVIDHRTGVIHFRAMIIHDRLTGPQTGGVFRAADVRIASRNQRLTLP